MHQEPKGMKSRKAAATAANSRKIKQSRSRKRATSIANAAALSIGHGSVKNKY